MRSRVRTYLAFTCASTLMPAALALAGSPAFAGRSGAAEVDYVREIRPILRRIASSATVLTCSRGR